MIPVHELSAPPRLPDFLSADTQSLQLRTELMLGLQRHIQRQEWTTEQAAQALKQTLPRIQNLMNGEISRFSVEQLVNLLALVGLQVHISIME
ncbi:MAG: XRE family transcriptional regulator [Cyanobacteria bacterium P01_F01_bin.86]